MSVSRSDLERESTGPQHARRIAAVEQHFDLGGELVEQALEVEAVARIVREQRESGRHARKLRVAARVRPAAHALLHKAPRFEHLQGHEPVHERESRIPQVVCDSVGRLHAGSPLALNGGDQDIALKGLTLGQMRTTALGDAPVREDVERALELGPELVLQ